MGSELWVCNAGTIEYGSALALQERIREARQADLIPDVMLLLEHPPVYTRGRRSEPGELTMGVDWYRSQGIEIFDTRRGGKVTYHGPGQLVGYPIVAVDDVVAYVRLLERALIAALSEEGIDARARVDEGPAFTGVWVQERKIASIGVHLSRGVTTHGFALNVDNDMRPFDWVVACGLPDVRMTSVAVEKGLGVVGGPGGAAGGPAGAVAPVGPGGSTGLMPCIRKRVAFAVAQALGRRQRLVSLDRLQQHAAPAAEVGAASVIR
ncbi:MAG: lipoyl(octanoyl) transferase LipB [Conexibacteraceae bacterium]|nr:lipoyl(octanoyl) transferase LipB [Conexibacteraceae bacterium]